MGTAGRVALVTGASRGIGRAVALELGKAGAAVGINFRRDEAAAEEVAEQIRAGGGRAETFQASMSDPADVERLALDVLDRLGTVNVLVLNAGIASRGLSVADTQPVEVHRVVTTHALSAHQLVHRLLPVMRTHRRGDIIAVSSSELTHMKANGAPYNMGKAALEALALTLAKEEAPHGIRVNIIAPGLVVTDMGSRLVKAKLGVDDITKLDADQPFGRLTRPEDIAGAVAFLLSEDGGMITGQRVVIDAGADASPTG